ncbi:MAG: hypothetical protein LBL41_00755 [Bifidobacteriaceae bacterium]|jgi:hypothetical protein|nr:hypothetical protein [Bifidobacteriaceae bacterium]
MKKLFLTFALVSVLLLSACSASEPADTSANPYAERFAEERSYTNNDMQLEVLSDDKITEAEVKELTKLYTDCLDKAGGIEYSVNELYQVSLTYQVGMMTEDGPVEDEAMESVAQKKDDECRKATIGWVGVLYGEIAINPQKVSFDEVYATCWVRRGIVPEDFTVEDYRYYYKQLEIEQGKFEAEHPEMSSWGYNGPYPDLALPGGASIVNDERITACSADPRPEAD